MALARSALTGVLPAVVTVMKLLPTFRRGPVADPPARRGGSVHRDQRLLDTLRQRVLPLAAKRGAIEIVVRVLLALRLGWLMLMIKDPVVRWSFALFAAALPS